jgi:hypothetical protein
MRSCGPSLVLLHPVLPRNLAMHGAARSEGKGGEENAAALRYYCAITFLEVSEISAAPAWGDYATVLSCDASTYAIFAILSQKQNGLESSISFASRMLNKNEVNYSTTHEELLAVIFGTKADRCFLYERKFQIVTDHAALKWLITVKNHQCARLTCWVLKFSEY